MFRVTRSQYANTEERDSETKEMIFRSTAHGPFWSWRHFPYRWEVFDKFATPRYVRGWCLTFRRAQAKTGQLVRFR